MCGRDTRLLRSDPLRWSRVDSVVDLVAEFSPGFPASDARAGCKLTASPRRMKCRTDAQVSGASVREFQVCQAVAHGD